jgi:hydrogenase-4 component E
MHSITFDIAHMLAGSLVLVSFMQLYQDRLYALLNTFALHAFILAASVAWQAFIQDAPHLYVTAGIALIFKAIIIPVALHRIIVKLGIHREIETVVGVGPAMLLGMGLVALSMVVMLRVTAEADPLAREDLAFALSVVRLGLFAWIGLAASAGPTLRAIIALGKFQGVIEAATPIGCFSTRMRLSGWCPGIVSP